MDNFVNQVFDKFLEATITMWETLKLPQVWRPCFYMYLSLALSLNIQEGMFYWYTDTSKGLSFSEVFFVFISDFFFQLVFFSDLFMSISDHDDYNLLFQYQPVGILSINHS